MNTTLIVINNFKDKSDDWLYTSEDISRQCQTILAESGKYVDFWNIDACIGARYGLKVGVVDLLEGRSCISS